VIRLSRQMLEGITAVLLSVAGLATSWVSYQAARWGGVQAAKYTEASALRVESTRASTAAGQRQAIDVGLFMAWVTAFAHQDNVLTRFERERFRPEFRPAFEAWLASKPAQNREAPSSPFVMPQYTSALADSAVALELESRRAFEAAQAANEQSDAYVLDAVILASVLFFAGIAQQLRWRPAQLAMLSIASVCTVLGLFNIVRYPIQ
jgi:hypothetical protein